MARKTKMYQIWSDKSKMEYVKGFKDDKECMTWIENHLDLSLDWIFKPLGGKR
jgi:hypothetical protein